MLEGTNTHHYKVVIWVKNYQNELMVEVYSKSPVRAIGKVLIKVLMKLEHQLKHIKVMENGLCL